MAKSYKVEAEHTDASGKRTWGKTHRFESEALAQRYAIGRAKAAKSGTMIYLTHPDGTSEQYDPASWR